MLVVPFFPRAVGPPGRARRGRVRAVLGARPLRLVAQAEPRAGAAGRARAAVRAGRAAEAAGAAQNRHRGARGPRGRLDRAGQSRAIQRRGKERRD